MPTQDTTPIKEKILSFLKIKGPSLPVHMAKEIGMNTLFTSAFLSELISDRKIKISHMKVGSSRLHFLEGQESKLANFSQHLGRKEKEAFDLLKQNKFLKDQEIQPAIRVALRSLKDFAIPITRADGITWRYFTVPESELPSIKIEKEEEKEKPVEKPAPIKSKEPETIKEEPKEEKKDLKEIETKSKPKRKTSGSSKASQKKNEKFFNTVKEFLDKKQIQITDIKGFSKNDLTLKVKKNDREYLLVAFNKKRVTEQDIIKTHKKAQEENLKFLILSLGEPLKKLQSLIDAAKSLAAIEKLE